LVAEGHVFYASPDRSARSDHLVYEAAPDTITMTGDVVVVQNGQNVIGTDTLVIDVKTNNAHFSSNTQGRNHPERTRAVLYNSNNSQAAAPSKPAAGAPASKP
jgi:lipopolysaccharide export system protein LptA